MSTLYASFVDAAAAERAAGALLDRGAVAEDLSIVANEAYNSARSINANAKALDAEHGAKIGLSTTTPGDVAAGAVKGAAIGLGVGIAAALAAVFLPGVGLVIGGGALATALAGGAATTLAGAAAGGVAGYLVDQGVPMEMATRYSADFVQGGAILAVAIPTGNMPTGVVEETLVKYGANNVATYNSVRVADPAVAPPKVPLMTDNPNIDPIAVPAAMVPNQSVMGVPADPHVVVDASTGEARVVATQVAPTVVDPVTGVPVAAAAVDPLTGVERPIAVDPVTGAAVAPAVSPITRPVTGVTVDPVTGLPINPVPAMPTTAAVTVDPIAGTPAVTESATTFVQTAPAAAAIDPVSGVAMDPVTVVDTVPSTGVVVDPATGMAAPGTPADGLVGDTVAPVANDVLIEDEENPVVVRKDVGLY